MPKVPVPLLVDTGMKSYHDRIIVDVIALLCYSNSLGPRTFDTWLYGHRRHQCGLWPVGQAELQSDPIKKSIGAEFQTILTYYFC